MSRMIYGTDNWKSAKDFQEFVRASIKSILEDSYVMDFGVEGVEPTQYAQSSGKDLIYTSANVYTSMLWSSGARPSDRKASKFIDTYLDNAVNEITDTLDYEDDAFTEMLLDYLNSAIFGIILTIDLDFYGEDDRDCDMTLNMKFTDEYDNGIVKYPSQTVSFSSYTNTEDPNSNYAEEGDFILSSEKDPDALHFVASDDFIYSFLENVISDYIKQF